MGAFGGPDIITDGLVFAMDPGSTRSYAGTGTTAYNIINNTSGTLENGVTFSTNNGGYFDFDGTDDYISDFSNTGITHGTSNFSYFFWINLQGKPSLGTILENGTWTSCILIRYETNGITIYSMSSYVGKFAFDPSLDTWNNVGFVRSGNFINFYLNGVYVSQLAFSATVAPTANIFIGTSQHATGQCFNGYIATATIYTKNLSTAEISQNYNAQKTRFI
tara:strand:- start:692 stop:1351 length:660 start_codon:yes stop_codon:yes gene_type:complete